MQTEWMGRYRPLVAALVQHSNITARAAARSNEIGEGIFLNTVSWQVLEYLIEHGDDASCMTHVHEALGIPQSSFSKIARQLTDLGLVERFRRPTNRKNVILRATPLGRELYMHQIEAMKAAGFSAFFETLDGLDDETIACFTLALNRLSGQVDSAVALSPLIPLESSDN